MKENLKALAICLLLITTVVLLYKGGSLLYTSHQNYIHNKQLQKDSIRKAFIKDSLEHDPHYQDSIRKSEAIFKALEDSIDAVIEKRIAGIMMEGDTIYHSAFHGDFSIEDAERLFLVTNKYVEDNELEQCEVCRNNDFEIRIEDGDYISKEDADDYCSHNEW